MFFEFELLLDQKRPNSLAVCVSPHLYFVDRFFRCDFEVPFREEDVLSFGDVDDFLLMVGDEVEVSVVNAYLKGFHVSNLEGDAIDLSHVFTF